MNTKLHYTFLLGIILFINSLVYSQKPPAKFGDIDIEDLKMTVCPLDSNAGAMYLLDYGSTWFDSQLTGKFTTHVRIKVFSKDELDRGNITIVFPKGSRVERIKASAYNLENGKIVESEFDKKESFDESINKYVSSKKINLSNVKEGSIIEYQYTINNGDLYDLNSWTFQTSVPVRYSEYRVEYPEYFIYKTIMSGYIQLNEVNNDQKMNDGVPFKKTQYIARDVPSFKSEPFLTSRSNYISQIKFEIESINVPGYTFKRVLPSDYPALAEVFYKDYEEEMKRTNFLNETLEMLTTGIDNDLEKIKAIYYYIQANFKKDDEYEDYSLKKAFDEKTGTNWQLNALFTMLLQQANIKANMVALSTRSHGILHPYYPMAKQFNYYITYANEGENEFTLDPSDKYVPFGILPEKCLNGWGMPIVDKGYKKVPLNSGHFSRLISGEFDLSEEGILEGKLEVSMDGYQGITRREKIKTDGEEKYREETISKKDTWEVEEMSILGLDENEGPITESYSLQISESAQGMGNIIYLTPVFHGGISENPFKLEKRMYPVDYGANIKETISLKIKIPEGYIVDEMPKPLALGLPNNSGRFIYNTQQIGDIINVTCQFQILKPVFIPDEYIYIRAFYDQIVAKYKEQIVLKKL